MIGADKRVLVAMTADAAGQFWFFKLTGPSGLVEKNKNNFQSFLKTARFVGGDDR